MAKKLNPTILDLLHERTGKAVSTLRSAVSRKRQSNPGLTGNAAAHLVAQDHGTSVLQKLDDDDRASLRGSGLASVHIPASRSGPRTENRKSNRRKQPIVTYDSEEYFVREHLLELSRAYHSECYTCVFILFRKILENCIVDLLRAKFPGEPDLFFDKARSRNHDFSVVLHNLHKKRTTFTADGKKAIERLNQLAVAFKKDANDKVHSWFHVVTSQNEIDKNILEQILQLVQRLEIEVGTRSR